MNKEGRLTSGKNWIKTYNGKNLVKGYSKWYGVDLMCAIKELRLLGVEISRDYEEQVKRSIEDRIIQRRERKLKNLESEEILDFWDSEFEFIAGYTSGGLPFGIMKGQDFEE